MEGTLDEGHHLRLVFLAIDGTRGDPSRFCRIDHDSSACRNILLSFALKAEQFFLNLSECIESGDGLLAEITPLGKRNSFCIAVDFLRQMGFVEIETKLWPIVANARVVMIILGANNASSLLQKGDQAWSVG